MNIFQILCLQFFSLSLNKIIAFQGQKYQFIKSHRVSWCICFSFQALPYWGDTLLCRKISDYYSMKPLGPAAPKLLVTPRMLQFISDFCSVIELHWSPWKIKKEDYVLCNILCREYLCFGLFPEWNPDQDVFLSVFRSYSILYISLLTFLHVPIMIYDFTLPFWLGSGARPCLIHVSEAMASMESWVNDGEWPNEKQTWGIESLFLIPTKQENEQQKKQTILYFLACSRIPDVMLMHIMKLLFHLCCYQVAIRRSSFSKVRVILDM